MSRNRSRLCPYCRALNSSDGGHCVRCERKLPGPILTTVLEILAAAGATGAPVTVLFLVINLAVFAAMHTGPGQASQLLDGASAYRLGEYGAILSPITDLEWWRTLSANFVHIGLLHIGMNMFALVQIGRAAERLVGSGRFALAYVLSGMAGFWISIGWAHYQGQILTTAGASASIFGLLGLLLGWLLGRRDERWKNFAIQAVVYSLAFGFVMRANNAAHIGGLVAGALLGFLFANERRPYRRNKLAGVLGVVSILAVMGSLVLSRISPISKVFGGYERQRIELGQ